MGSVLDTRLNELGPVVRSSAKRTAVTGVLTSPALLLDAWALGDHVSIATAFFALWVCLLTVGGYMDKGLPKRQGILPAQPELFSMEPLKLEGGVDQYTVIGLGSGIVYDRSFDYMLAGQVASVLNANEEMRAFEAEEQEKARAAAIKKSQEQQAEWDRLEHEAYRKRQAEKDAAYRARKERDLERRKTGYETGRVVSKWDNEIMYRDWRGHEPSEIIYADDKPVYHSQQCGVCNEYHTYG